MQYFTCRILPMDYYVILISKFKTITMLHHWEDRNVHVFILQWYIPFSVIIFPLVRNSHIIKVPTEKLYLPAF